VPPHDAKACAQAISRVLTDDNLAEQMRQKGWEYAHRNFAPSVLSQQLLQYYQDLL
jgi:glycosyltransferase involved in cell wall biosynthesis